MDERSLRALVERERVAEVVNTLFRLKFVDGNLELEKEPRA